MTSPQISRREVLFRCLLVSNNLVKGLRESENLLSFDTQLDPFAGANILQKEQEFVQGIFLVLWGRIPGFERGNHIVLTILRKIFNQEKTLGVFGRMSYCFHPINEIYCKKNDNI